MKITIEELAPGEEEEIIIRCDTMNDELMKLVKTMKQGNQKMNLYNEGEIFFLPPEDIYYFESVDQKVFAYGEQSVYETKSKLYELEMELPAKDFLRATKSTIINLNKIKSIAPAFGGRFEALLRNGERVIISRQYVSDLKEKLGV